LEAVIVSGLRRENVVRRRLDDANSAAEKAVTVGKWKMEMEYADGESSRRAVGDWCACVGGFRWRVRRRACQRRSETERVCGISGIKGEIKGGAVADCDGAIRRGDLQILNIVANSTKVKKGDVLVEFDGTTSSRIGAGQSALTSAEAEIHRRGRPRN